MKTKQMLDFTTAWSIQKECGESLQHHPKCSSVPGWCSLSGPSFLCDCGAIEREFNRRIGKHMVEREGE